MWLQLAIIAAAPARATALRINFIIAFRSLELSFVHQFHHLPHGLPYGFFAEQFPVFPGLFDYLFEFAVHDFRLFLQAKVTQKLRFPACR